MSKKLAFERYIWFIDQARKEKYPNAKKLSEYRIFEISISQAQRDIKFMRDFLHAPLTYDYYHKGYSLSNESFQLPTVWIQNEELLLFALSKELVKDKDSKKILSELFKKISMFSDDSLRKIEDFITYKNVRFYRLKTGVLSIIISALMDSKKIEMTYISVFDINKKPFKITITPIHLVFYRGNWYMLGRYRRVIRIYALSRIKQVKEKEEYDNRKPNSEQLKKMINKSFGIFIPQENDKVYTIKLQFDSYISQYVQTIVFHPKQKYENQTDGSIIVSFPSTINNELLGEIFRFRDNVIVLEPDKIKKELKSILNKMTKKYK